MSFEVASNGEIVILPLRVGRAILRNTDEWVFLVQRGETRHNPFGWELPGGKARPGESIEHATTRETKEEINLDVEALDDFVLAESRQMDNHPWNRTIETHVAEVTIAEKSAPFKLSKEHINAMWVPDEFVASVEGVTATTLLCLDKIPAGSYPSYS